MMEDDDTSGKKEDPIVVQSLADFKYNCELLEGSLGNEDTDFAAEINKLGTWIKWITDRKGTQDHNNHFFKNALPRITRVLLARMYKHPDTEVPLVVTFLKEMMKVVITHMEADVPEVWGMFRTLLNPKMPFYVTHGQDCVPPSPPKYDSDSDNEAAATGTAPWMKAGDTINMNLGGSLIKAKVLELSPTNTEVNLNFVELGATQWLSVDDERLTPLDAEHPTTATPDAATDAAAAAEAEEDPEKAAELARQRAEFEAREAVWRNKLAVGRLVDAVDTAKMWYQAVVVDEKEPEADAADADASATDSKGDPATEAAEAGDDAADGTAEEKSEAKCTERQVKVSFLGWPCAYDEWLPVSSRRMAELNTRSQGRRGNGSVVVALTDQQLEVDDDNDPEDAVAVIRPWKSQHLVDLLASFATCRGFVGLHARLQRMEPPMHISVVRIVICAVADVADLFTKPFATRWLGHIIQDFQKQLTNMSAATVRALAPDMVNDFVRCFRLLGRRIMTAEDTGRLVEHLNLDIGRQCFCSDFFERRLNGLSYIQGCIRMVENRDSSPNGIQVIPALSTTGSQILRTHVLPVAQYLTAPMLVEWLRANRVLEDLFQDRRHLELMKRSLPVLQFLAKHKALTAADLAIVWGASVTSHEPTIEAVYQTVGVLAASLEEDLQLVLFGYVRDIETAELNKLSLQLIADLALASGDVGGACRSAANLLWDLMLDASSLSPVLAALAENKLLHVVTTTRYNEWRTDFMELCMQGLAASNTSPQMLRLLKGIVHTFSAKTPEGAASSPRADVIDNLNAKSNLLQALFEDLQRYNSAARDAAAAGLAADPDFKAAGMFVGGSRTKHADQISGRLSFLGYVLECSPLEVTREQVDLLWNELAVGGVSDADRSLALSWFCQGTDAIMKGDGLLFSSETALHVFNSRMSEESYTNNLSKSGFSCLRAFFLLANHVANRVVATDLHTHYVVADLDLVGLDVIWNVALRCQDNVVATQAERFLTVLLKKLAEPAAMTGDYRRDYVNRCMALLQETHEGEEAAAATARLERCVELLAAMLTASDVDSAGRFTAHAPELPGSPITVKVHNHIAGHPGKGKPMTVTVYSNQRAFHLIAALADALGYNRTSLKVTVAAKDISKKSMARYSLMSLNVTDGKSVIVSGASRRHKSKKEKQAEKEKDEAAAAAAKEDGEASGAADTSGTSKKKKDKVEMPAVMVLPEEDLAHNIMSHTPEVFNALLGSLDGIAAGDEKAETVTQQVWKLLLRLPTNPQVLHGVRSLASVKAGDAASWRELLDDASSVRLLYSLQIVETMLKNPMDQVSKEKEEEAAASKTDGEEEAKGEGETKGAADPQPDADAEADEDALQREAAAAEAAAKKAAKQAELEAEAAFRDEWRARFMALGGFQHLLTLLMHDGGVVARAGTEGDLGKTAVALLLRIVRYCFTAAATAAAEHTPEVLKSLRLVAMRSTGGVGEDAPPAEAKGDATAEAKGEDSNQEAKASVPAEVAAAAKAMAAARKVYTAVVTPPDAPSPPMDTQTSPLDPELMTAKLSQEQGQAALAGVDMAGVQQRLLAIIAASLDGEVSVLDARMVSRACGLWQTSLLHQPSLWAARPEECTIDFFTQALLKGDGDGALAVRMHVASAINRICTAIPALPEGEAHPAAFFVRGLLAHMPLDATPAQTKTVGQYFDLTAALVAHVCEGRHGFAASDFEAHVEQLVHAVRDRPMCESRQNTDVDLVLVGLLDVIRVLVSSSRALRKAAGQAQSSGGSGLASYLFNECLFLLPDPRALFNSTSAQPPKCKRSRTRRAAFALLAALARDVPSVVDSLNGSMRGLVDATEATTHFKVNPKLNEKSATGYVGLQNLGCICYMNSLMQQLYMIEPIRYGVLSVLDPKEDKKESLLYQLQSMFGYLELSEQRAYRPAPWCHAFKDMSGRPTNVMVQEDAQEFFNQVCDRMESALRGTPQERLMQSTLRGLFSIQLVCQGDGCDFVSGRPEPFACISVEVQGHDNLEDSLKTLVNGELITDYFCDRCQGKRDVRKRSCLDKLNNTMLLHLQRFKFNFDTFQREKINDKFEFPTTIDMYPYSLEGLSWLKEVAAQEAAFAAVRAAAEADGAEESKGDAPVAPPEVPRPYKLYPKEYYEYELVGCVVHTGTADSGHYYSFIKERGEFFRSHHRGAKDDQPAEWFEFNDALVKPFAVKDLASECFGGKSSSWSSTSKRRNAYMLVYERTSPVAAEDYDAAAASAKPADASTPAGGTTPAGADDVAPDTDQKGDQKGDKGATPAGAGDGAGAGATAVIDDEIVTLGAQNHVRVPKSVCDAVFKANRNHLHATLVNDPELFHFATCLAQDLEVTMEPLPPYTVEGDVDPVNNLLNFGLRVLVRSSQNSAFPAFAAALTPLFRANPPACKRFLFNATADISVVVDPLVRCPSQEARVAFAALLTAVLETLADEEVELLQETIDVEVPVVVEPTPPGGEDAKADEEAPADPEAPTTTTVQQCITFTGRFWDSILDYETLDTVCKSWRQFAEFWTVLLRFAQSGPQQRAFLVSRDTVMRLLDLYLGQASPMQATLFKDSKRVRTSMSSRYVKPKWHHAFATVAELVQCSFTDATTVLEKGIPPALLDTTPNTLPPHSRKMILNQKLYTLALGRRVACEALARIMAHWSWEWPDYSKSVVQIVQRGLAAAAATDVAPYFKVLDEFFAVDDSLSADRVEWVFTGEPGLLPLFKSRRTTSPLFTFECIRNLLPLVQKHSSVGAFFSADADTLAWVELFLRRYAKSAKLEQELHETPGSVPTAPTVPTEEEAMLRIIGAAIGIDMGSAVSSIGVGTSSDDVKVVVEAQKVELAEKALALLGDVVTSFGGALVGEEALVAAEAAAEAAAKAADGADGADVMDDDAPSDEDGAPIAPEA